MNPVDIIILIIVAAFIGLFVKTVFFTKGGCCSQCDKCNKKCQGCKNCPK